MDNSYNAYNTSKKSKKEILNKDICREKLLREAKPQALISLSGLILVLTLGIFLIVLSIMTCIWTFGEVLHFVGALVMTLVLIALMVCLVVRFGISLIDVLKIKKGNIRITEETVDYKTVEYVYKYVGTGKYRLRKLVAEYVIYFTGLGRYVDSNDELSIYNTSTPEDKFYIVTANSKKPRYAIVLDQKYYSWEE